MELTAFETWLAGIDTLTEPQPRHAQQALALREAADSQDIEIRTTSGQDAPSLERAVDEPQPANLPLAAPPANLFGAAGVAALGQRRVDSVGCPHCDNRDVARWGQASDLPRYRSKACSRTFNPDENAVGEFAHEGEMGERARERGGADRGYDRWRQRGASRAAVRRALHHGVSLAAPVSGCPGRR